MKARLLESVAGIISRAGFMPFALAVAARMGIRILAVAVLLVNSERNVIEKQTMAMTASVGQSRRPCAKLPMTADRPELSNAVAIAMPPPNKMRIPHGIFSAV